MLRVISLGAGVQSTTMALMAAHGKISMPDCAVFADTQWEPREVYEHLTWLRSASVLPFPVHVVTAGNIRDDILARRQADGGRRAAIPWFTLSPKGERGMGLRQCTSEYKLQPIARKVRELLGKGPRDRIPAGAAEILIGISTDEAIRMKPSRQRYMTNRWPLIELGMSRRDCLRWLDGQGYSEPPKSSCVGCPFHSDLYWRKMRDTKPEEWADAVAVDRALREGDARGMRSKEFMHSERVPLDQVDLRTDDERGQPDMFGNDCEGMCGV